MAQQSLSLRHSTRSVKPRLLMAGQIRFMTPILANDLKSVECPEPVEGLSWVYILFCANGTFYVGQSCDVRKRLARHANGSGARHTRQLKHFRLVYVEGPLSSDGAVKREKQLKSWSRSKKLALICRDKTTLKKLSRSRETITPEPNEYNV